MRIDNSPSMRQEATQKLPRGVARADSFFASPASALRTDHSQISLLSSAVSDQGRSERLDALRVEIATERYSVPAAQISRALVDFYIGA